MKIVSTTKTLNFVFKQHISFRANSQTICKNINRKERYICTNLFIFIYVFINWLRYSNGDKEWYQDGNLHRTNGPAIECANGLKFWYLNGKEYSEEEFNLKQIIFN